MMIIKVNHESNTMTVEGTGGKIRRIDLFTEAAMAVRAAVTAVAQTSEIPYEIAEMFVRASYETLNESIEKETVFDASAFRKEN